MPRVSGSAWPWLLADDSDAIVGIRSGNVDQLFVFSNDDALNIDMSNLAATWNSAGTTFSAIKMNVTDTASAAGSLLLDLQVGGTSQFRVTKAGRFVSLGRATIDGLTVGLGGQTAVAGNTALGVAALNSASLTGGENLGVGVFAGLSLTTGYANTFMGYFSGFSATTGIGNVSTGAYSALALTTGSNNTTIGAGAGGAVATGGNNTAIGAESLYRFVVTGNQTAIGYRALYGGDATPANNTGANNIAIGYQAGDAITTGSTNIAIGYDVDVDSATSSNQINIGDRYYHNRIRLVETTDPAAPAADNAIIFCRDNGSGKTQICVQFPTGAVQVIATEP